MSLKLEPLKNEENSNDTTLELQLGDIIKISSPMNQVLNEKTFIIDYIDEMKTYLINTDKMDRIRVSISSDGTIGDGNIRQIAILSRADSPSYARQHELLPDTWINIHFGGDFPVIISGEITNLENDMIEVKTIDGDNIYINFDYKGIPEELPIIMFEITEKPDEDIIKGNQNIDQDIDQDIDDLQDNEPLENIPELGELEAENKYIEASKIQLNVPIKEIKDQIREVVIKADQIKFGNEKYAAVTQMVDVSTKSQRYSIETQVSDLLSDLLSTIPNSQRTQPVLNNIHTVIERFKQLREKFSHFDKYGNVEGFTFKGANYKPLTEYFNSFKTNLYWILPVVIIIPKFYTENVETTNSIIDMQNIIDQYNANDLSYEENKYKTLYSDLNPYFTPYDLVDAESQNFIIGKKTVNENINAIFEDNSEESNKIKRLYVIQKYNTSLTKLDTIDTNSGKFVTVRTNITANDEMQITSFITLPEPVIRFSKINLPGTSLLDKANLNFNFINYWNLLTNKTKINSVFIDKLETDTNESKSNKQPSNKQQSNENQSDDENEYNVQNNYNDNDKNNEKINILELNEQNFANNIKKYTLNLYDEDKSKMTTEDIYNKFTEMIIPKTRVLFNLMKKYITGKLSIVDVVSYLEPYLIYSDDLTFLQYKEITSFIDEEISKYNKKLIKRARIFKLVGYVKNKEALIPSRAFPIVESLTKKLHSYIFSDGYGMLNPEDTFTNSEILRKIKILDCGKLYTSAIAIQNFSLTFPTEFSNLFKEEKQSMDDKLNEEEEQDKCKNIIIAKYYNSLDELNNDNDKLIYFDKKYDKTNYGILEDANGYEKEVFTMSPDELKEHISNDLMIKKKLTETDADYLATTLVDGHKKVIDGQYCILYKGYSEYVPEEIDFYIRKNNKWELDKEVIKKNVNTDESSLLCDIEKQCMSVPKLFDDKCVSIKSTELGLQTTLLKDMIGEFDLQYKITKEQLQMKVEKVFTYNFLKISLLTKIETNNMLKYNNQKYKLGANIEEDKNDIPTSPYQSILDLILGQKDFVKKQTDIIRFRNTYCRTSLEGFGPLNEKESEHWVYCIKTGVKLMPAFVFNLADKFIKDGQYEYMNYLNVLKSQIGKESDEGGWWVDKHSGWTICASDFDAEEGYDEGFKISTRAVMEEDAGNKIMSAKAEKVNIYITPETITINNIINTISIAMGINIENQKEFIINLVTSTLRETVETERDYNEKNKEKAEKGKKTMSYKDFYNTAVLYYTLAAILIAIQTAIPSIVTRKTHPGCRKSFTGYPLHGQGDDTSLKYLACVAYDIRESGEPWDVMKGKKTDVIEKKIKSVLDGSLLSKPDVKIQIDKKLDYLLTNETEEIPQEHDVAKWIEFLPPLMRFKIKFLVNIPSEFKKTLLNEMRSGSIHQRDKLLVVETKIIQFALSIIERIQEAVKTHKILLHNSNNEPYLENACCESKKDISTISYFMRNDPKINEYNEIVTQLSNFMDDITSYTKANMFYSNKNTKNKYPDILNEFNEKTIYLSFIHFCKFKTVFPIPADLIPFCKSKPPLELFNSSDTQDRLIQKLKDDGRHYKNEQFLRLLQIIGQHNTIKVNFNSVEASSITKLVKTVEEIKVEKDTIIDEELSKLIIEALDTFKIATDEYTPEVRALNNYLADSNKHMKKEILEFIETNSSNISKSSVKKTETIMSKLSEWVADNSFRNPDIKISDDNLYNIVNFYKTFIDNFTNVFPNIILNKVKYSEVVIPKHYNFSRNHANNLRKYISGYYEKLVPFYGKPNYKTSYENILSNIQTITKNIVFIANNTPGFTSIQLKDKTIKPVIDERTARFLFEHYLLLVFKSYIKLAKQDDMIIKAITPEKETIDLFAYDYIEDIETASEIVMPKKAPNANLLKGKQKELKEKIAEILVAFIEIMNNEKANINTSYEEIQDNVFKLREREKDMVTDRLKGMSDELREADTNLKINKLGMYSKGMQKGLTTLDKDFYDEEQAFRDEMNKAERNIRKNNLDANDANIDILLDDYRQEQQDNADIENEVYDMKYLRNNYYDGNTDGMGEPEYEYDDDQEDY